MLITAVLDVPSETERQFSLFKILIYVHYRQLCNSWSLHCCPGLLILNAWYGKFVSETSQKQEKSKVIDVTVPLQCLVKDSKLILTESSKVSVCVQFTCLCVHICAKQIEAAAALSIRLETGPTWTPLPVNNINHLKTVSYKTGPPGRIKTERRSQRVFRNSPRNVVLGFSSNFTAPNQIKCNMLGKLWGTWFCPQQHFGGLNHVHVNPRIQGLSAEYCTVVRWSMFPFDLMHQLLFITGCEFLNAAFLSVQPCSIYRHQKNPHVHRNTKYGVNMCRLVWSRAANQPWTQHGASFTFIKAWTSVNLSPFRFHL